MADKSVIFTLIAKDAASGAIKSVDKAMDGLHSTGGRLGGVLGGLGGILTSLPVLIGGAGITAALVGMTKAAADDEASMKKLTTAVAANVQGWDGHTDALDAAIAKSQSLGFTDDDVRDSLTRLITSTHDVTEATQLNAAAMDLARLKGIPLADAANIIGKVHDGNVGILSRYGIEVAKGATATEALAAIQAAASGQAEAYGATTAGGMDRLNIAVGELGEQVGTLFLPVMQGVVSLLNDTLLPAISGIIASISGGGGLGAAFSGSAPFIGGLVKTLTDFATMVTTQLIPTLIDLVERVWNGGLKDFFSTFAEIAGRVYSALTKIFTAVLSNKDVLNILRTAADLVGAALKFMADFTKTAFDILGELFSAITSNKTVMAGLEAVVKGIWTGMQTLVGFVTTAVTWIGNLFTAIATNKDVIAIFRGVVDAIAAGFQAAWDAVAGFFGVLKNLWDFVQNNPVASVLGGIGDIVAGQATGGYVGAGSAYVVGEHGPELFVPSLGRQDRPEPVRGGCDGQWRRERERRGERVRPRDLRPARGRRPAAGSAAHPRDQPRTHPPGRLLG